MVLDMSNADTSPGTTEADTWSPTVYERFRADRERPVRDLLDLLRPQGPGRALDLGCGTGRYTPDVHARTGATETVGVDSSAQMLTEAGAYAGDGVRFVEADLGALDLPWWDDVHTVFSNAAFQWVPGHQELLGTMVDRLRPGGQIAFQVPSNYDHPSHVVADAVGRDFGLDPLDRTASVASPARYAELLWSAGLRELDVSLRIYGMELARTDDVIAWVSGTLLTSFERRLDAETFAAFRDEYRRRLLAELGDPAGESPYYFAFPRILAAGHKP